jgi:hypothetical protein
MGKTCNIVYNGNAALVYAIREITDGLFYGHHFFFFLSAKIQKTSIGDNKNNIQESNLLPKKTRFLSATNQPENVFLPHLFKGRKIDSKVFGNKVFR